MGKITVGGSNISFKDTLSLATGMPQSYIDLENVIYQRTYALDPASAKVSMYINRDLFWAYTEPDETSRGSVAMTYPLSLSGAAPPPGYGIQFKSTSYSYLTFVATPAYGETFYGWYSQFWGGTLISTNRTYSLTLANSAAWTQLWGRFTTNAGGYTGINLNTTPRSSSSVACQNLITPNTSACWNGDGAIPDIGGFIYISTVTAGVPTSLATKFNGNSQWFSLYQASPSTVIQISSLGVVINKANC